VVHPCLLLDANSFFISCTFSSGISGYYHFLVCLFFSL
jgi:hypothetical protein